MQNKTNNDLEFKLSGIARVLLEELTAFYADPENEKAFLEWKATRETAEKAG